MNISNTPLSPLAGDLPPGALPLPGLPSLREDLVLFDSSANPDGSPTWVVQDPVRNKFIRIGWLEFEMLSRWGPDPMALLRSLIQETTLRPGLEDVLAFAYFLRAQGLVQLLSREDRTQARRAPEKPGISQWRWWLHNYLFFRIPLARPDRWLQKLAPKVEWLFSASVLSLLVVVCGLGAVLAGRQSELFLQTFVDSFSLSGLMSFALALVLAKTLHEMGHAVVATRYGVRVAHVGVAFLVLWPMLYTDTGESWRLSNPRHRLNIAVAGMSVECVLAGLSLLGWALTPPGALRGAFFYLATTSLIMTIALNMSPFMRFDGYYVLSDALNMPNLHERSGHLAKTWVRRTFLGWADPWPEHFMPAQHAALVVFAIGTWVYRFFLFLGIAVAVYVMFFKLLGIFLFLIEIVWFVLRPIYTECLVWSRRKKDIQRGRASLWLMVLLLGLGLLAFPWAHDIHAVAQLRAENQTIYSPIAGRIVTLHAPGAVDKGDVLVTLDSDKLRSDAERAKINITATRAALVSAEMTPEKNRDQVGKLGVTVEQFIAEDHAAGQELARMRMSAEFSARWTDVDPTLVVGSWLRPQDAVGTLVDESTWLVEAWVPESEVQYLQVNAEGKYYPANRVESSLSVKVIDIDTVRASSLPHPGLSSEHGGPIPTSTDGKVLIPREGLYRVHLQVQGRPDALRWSRGVISVGGTRHSKLWLAVRYASSVLIRESGF
jgi:putative peptide zinc metalloprotease protein